MDKELKIKFVEKIKYVETGNKLIDGLLVFILYPLVLVFGLLAMCFVGLLSFWQNVTSSKKELQEVEEMKLEITNENKQWSIFTTAPNVAIEKQLAGRLPWDSGDYFYLKSRPEIEYLNNRLFGDWLLVAFGGVFLQKWNDTRNINCDLAFIDLDTLKVTELKANIPTKHWETEKINENEIKFTFSTSNSDMVYIINRELHFLKS